MKNYSFLNVSSEKIDTNLDGFDVINIKNLNNFKSLGKWWAETEAIYNVYLNELYKDYDYIGFIHWDHELKIEKENSERFNVTESITNFLQMKLDNSHFIAFQTIKFDLDFNQGIMMDEKFPNKLTGSGQNCWHTIINDYNKYFNRKISFNDLKGRDICISSTFFCSKDLFEKMMKFYSFIIENNYLNKFDVYHRYRFQGGMMERYAGIFLSDYNIFKLPLAHHTKFNFLKFIKFFIYKYFLRFLLLKKYEKL